MKPRRTASGARSTYICCGRTTTSAITRLPRCRTCGGTMKLIDR